MAERAEEVAQATAPIAGIAILHELEDGIVLEAHEREGWACDAAAIDESAIVVRHRVCADDVADPESPVFGVNSRISYYAGERGGTDVVFQDPQAGTHRVLRTIRPGQEYVVNYGARPEQPVLRRQIEMAVYSLALGERGRGVMAHGCGAVLANGLGVLCLGRSGAGKSTLGRMLRGNAGVTVLNDDRIVVTSEPEELRMWSTPWPGRAGIAVPGDATLAAVAFIGRGDEHVARPARATDVLGRLLTTVAVPMWAPSSMAPSLSIVGRMLDELPVIDLAYPLEPATGAWLVETLTRISNE